MVSVEVTSGRGRKEMQEKAVQRFGEEESRLGAKAGRSLCGNRGVRGAGRDGITRAW